MYIHDEEREVLQHGVGDPAWASGRERSEIGGSRKKFTRGEQEKRNYLG